MRCKTCGHSLTAHEKETVQMGWYTKICSSCVTKNRENEVKLFNEDARIFLGKTYVISVKKFP